MSSKTSGVVTCPTRGTTVSWMRRHDLSEHVCSPQRGSKFPPPKSWQNFFSEETSFTPPHASSLVHMATSARVIASVPHGNAG